MIVATITLGFTTIVNAIAACFIFYGSQKERDTLLTRIQAPEAARIAAVASSFDSIPTAEEVEAQVGLNVPWDDDLRMILSEEDA